MKIIRNSKKIGICKHRNPFKEFAKSLNEKYKTKKLKSEKILNYLLNLEE